MKVPRVALLADVHANEPALEAVLEALEARQPDLVIVLGDLVGYNASPLECIARVREVSDVAVMGNHDFDVVGESFAPGTNNNARLAQDWTRSVLTAEAVGYLGGLPRRWDGEGMVAVHGCYLNDRYFSGYITTTMLERNLQVVAGSCARGTVAFCGHTHIPMIGWLVGGSCVEPNVDGLIQWPHGASSILINPGAVGQPRDGDHRAAFALVDTDARTVEFLRVAYNIDRTVAAIARAGLPRLLGDRLREGR